MVSTTSSDSLLSCLLWNFLHPVKLQLPSSGHQRSLFVCVTSVVHLSLSIQCTEAAFSTSMLTCGFPFTCYMHESCLFHTDWLHCSCEYYSACLNVADCYLNCCVKHRLIRTRLTVNTVNFGFYQAGLCLKPQLVRLKTVTEPHFGYIYADWKQIQKHINN